MMSHFLALNYALNYIKSISDSVDLALIGLSKRTDVDPVARMESFRALKISRL